MKSIATPGWPPSIQTSLPGPTSKASPGPSVESIPCAARIVISSEPMTPARFSAGRPVCARACSDYWLLRTVVLFDSSGYAFQEVFHPQTMCSLFKRGGFAQNQYCARNRNKHWQ